MGRVAAASGRLAWQCGAPRTCCQRSRRRDSSRCARRGLGFELFHELGDLQQGRPCAGGLHVRARGRCGPDRGVVARSIRCRSTLRWRGASRCGYSIACGGCCRAHQRDLLPPARLPGQPRRPCVSLPDLCRSSLPFALQVNRPLPGVGEGVETDARGQLVQSVQPRPEAAVVPEPLQQAAGAGQRLCRAPQRRGELAPIRLSHAPPSVPSAAADAAGSAPASTRRLVPASSRTLAPAGRRRGSADPPLHSARSRRRRRSRSRG